MVYYRSLGQGNGKGIFRRILQHQLITGCCLCGQGQQVGCQRFETRIGIVVVAVVFKGQHFFSVGQQFRRGPAGPGAFYLEGLHRKRLAQTKNLTAFLSFPGPEGPGLGLSLDGRIRLNPDNPVFGHFRQCEYLHFPISPDRLEMRFHIFHALLRSYPGAAGLAPARTVEHAQFYIQIGRRLHGGVGYLPPLVREQRHTHIGIIIRRLVTDKSAGNAHPFHGFQVLDNAFLGDIVVQPVPVNGHPDGIRRVLEAFPQRLPGALTTGTRQQQPASQQGRIT